MNYYVGDIAALFCKFTVDNKVVKVDNPQVRILHEFEDKVYEDLSWQNMKQFDDGYIYNFDTNSCEVGREYVAVFKGNYEDKTLHTMSKLNIIVKNEQNINTIKVYGYINDINNKNRLKDVEVSVTDVNNNTVIYQTSSDYDGRWEVSIIPGEYIFSFQKKDYLERSVRVQIGDENSENQFNNINLEYNGDKNLGCGTYKIQDKFTNKAGQGIENVEVIIYGINDLKNSLVQTKTNKRGEWKAFLDYGNYILKVITPAKVERKFQLNVYNNGDKQISEFSQEKTAIEENIKADKDGLQIVSDYVLDAHGKGIPMAKIEVLEYSPATNLYDKLICEDTTNYEGHFELRLPTGKYQFVITADNFQTVHQIINI